MSGMGATLQLNGGATLAAAPGGIRGPDGPGRPAVRLGPVLRWFRVGPLAGHQGGHSLWLVLVRMVHP